MKANKNPLDKFKSKQFNKDEIGFDTMGAYITVFIVLFHVVPLLTVFIKSQDSLMSVLLMIVNPMAVFITSAVFGIKRGFSWKVPVITAVLFAPSVLMYYMDIQAPEDVRYTVQTTLIFSIVYFIFSLIADAAGGYLKKYL